jgi:hypothetical protein
MGLRDLHHSPGRPIRLSRRARPGLRKLPGKRRHGVVIALRRHDQIFGIARSLEVLRRNPDDGKRPVPVSEDDEFRPILDPDIGGGAVDEPGAIIPCGTVHAGQGRRARKRANRPKAVLHGALPMADSGKSGRDTTRGVGARYCLSSRRSPRLRPAARAPRAGREVERKRPARRKLVHRHYICASRNCGASNISPPMAADFCARPKHP